MESQGSARPIDGRARTVGACAPTVRTAAWRFVLFGPITPNVFALFGILVAHGHSMFLSHPYEIGTYAMFAVLFGSASYIAVPAIHRLAIREASPTLGLAASLGLTFSYNLTIGIPLYILIATVISTTMPLICIM